MLDILVDLVQYLIYLESINILHHIEEGIPTRNITEVLAQNHLRIQTNSLDISKRTVLQAVFPLKRDGGDFLARGGGIFLARCGQFFSCMMVGNFSPLFGRNIPLLLIYFSWGQK